MQIGKGKLQKVQRVGEKVYIKNMVKENKLSSTFIDTPLKVINRNGGGVIL